MSKCCSGHTSASNRAERRAADRLCLCRGECDWHPHPRYPARNSKEVSNG